MHVFMYVELKLVVVHTIFLAFETQILVATKEDYLPFSLEEDTAIIDRKVVSADIIIAEFDVGCLLARLHLHHLALLHFVEDPGGCSAREPLQAFLIFESGKRR